MTRRNTCTNRANIAVEAAATWAILLSHLLHNTCNWPLPVPTLRALTALHGMKLNK